MRGSLGEKIGEGVWADVHAWAPGQVVKLFKSGVSRRLSWHEAQKTDAVFAAGGPAPEVFGEVSVEGRFGIVLSRFDGPTLLHLSRTRAMTSEQVGAILAALCMSVHNTPPPPSTLRAATSPRSSSPRRSSTIRSGRAPTVRPRSPSTRGWPACPKRR